MTRIDVSERIFLWALDRSNLTEDSLVKKFPKIREWISGAVRPTLRQLESFAKATRTPFGYFFLDNPPDERLPIPHFRTIDDEEFSQPSPDLIDTVHTMQRRQAWMREFLLENGEEPLSFVGSSNPAEDPVSIADKMRRLLGFGSQWAASYSGWTHALRVLQNAMEDIGILVVVNGVVGNNTRRGLNPAEFRGFVLVDDFAPLVFVNGADGKAAQMFTLAHELAHVLLGSSASFDLRGLQPADDPVEQACNRIAAEFLVPETELREIWPKVQHDLEPVQSVARFFKVSQVVAARRALDVSILTKTEFFEFYNRYLEGEQRTKTAPQTGGDFWANQNLRIGRRFGADVVRAAQEGRILYTEAYDLTGLYGKAFHKYAQSLKEGGAW
jgi:Zn-dependent peptidase ImmA (M78 family)